MTDNIYILPTDDELINVLVIILSKGRGLTHAEKKHRDMRDEGRSLFGKVRNIMMNMTEHATDEFTELWMPGFKITLNEEPIKWLNGYNVQKGAEQ